MDMEETWADVPACTLPTPERPLRVAEFDDLFATSLRSIAETGRTSVRLLLEGDAEVAGRTQRLADDESRCCSFFAFRVTRPEADRVALDIEVPPSYADVLAGLTGRARKALEGAA